MPVDLRQAWGGGGNGEIPHARLSKDRARALRNALLWVEEEAAAGCRAMDLRYGLGRATQMWGFSGCGARGGGGSNFHDLHEARKV